MCHISASGKYNVLTKYRSLHLADMLRSQRVNKLSRRGTAGSENESQSVTERAAARELNSRDPVPDLDSSDDFSSTISLARLGSTTNERTATALGHSIMQKSRDVSTSEQSVLPPASPRTAGEGEKSDCPWRWTSSPEKRALPAPFNKKCMVNEIEQPKSAESKTSRCIQLTDTCAFAIKKDRGGLKARLPVAAQTCVQLESRVTQNPSELHTPGTEPADGTSASRDVSTSEQSVPPPASPTTAGEGEKSDCPWRWTSLPEKHAFPAPFTNKWTVTEIEQTKSAESKTNRCIQLTDTNVFATKKDKGGLKARLRCPRVAAQTCVQPESRLTQNSSELHPPATESADGTSASAAASSSTWTSTAAPVLDCPICLVSLPSRSARAAHLKLCAERSGLTTAQLLRAVQLQERQLHERMAAGLPVLRGKSNHAARRARKPRPRGRITIPAQTSVDLHMQMALAVSASLQEEEHRRRRLAEEQLVCAGLAAEVPEQRRARPLAVTSDAGSHGSTRPSGGSSRHAKLPITELQRQTPEQRQRLLCEQVAQLLAMEEKVPVEKALLPRQAIAEPAVLWRKTTQVDVSEAEFYVPELQDRVQPCSAPIESSLREVREIPGRLNLSQQVDEPVDANDIEDDVQNPSDSVQSTQAALAMLAENSDSYVDTEEEVHQSEARTENKDLYGRNGRQSPLCEEADHGPDSAGQYDQQVEVNDRNAASEPEHNSQLTPQLNQTRPLSPVAMGSSNGSVIGANRRPSQSQLLQPESPDIFDDENMELGRYSQPVSESADYQAPFIDSNNEETSSGTTEGPSRVVYQMDIKDKRLLDSVNGKVPVVLCERYIAPVDGISPQKQVTTAETDVSVAGRLRRSIRPPERFQIDQLPSSLRPKRTEVRKRKTISPDKVLQLKHPSIDVKTYSQTRKSSVNAIAGQLSATNVRTYSRKGVDSAYAAAASQMNSDALEPAWDDPESAAVAMWRHCHNSTNRLCTAFVERDSSVCFRMPSFGPGDALARDLLQELGSLHQDAVPADILLLQCFNFAVPVHGTVLRLRSPDLWSQIQNKAVFYQLNNRNHRWSCASVWAMVKLLYLGEINCTNSSVSDLMDLAMVFNLDELVQHLRNAHMNNSVFGKGAVSEITLTKRGLRPYNGSNWSHQFLIEDSGVLPASCRDNLRRTEDYGLAEASADSGPWCADIPSYTPIRLQASSPSGDRDTDGVKKPSDDDAESELGEAVGSQTNVRGVLGSNDVSSGPEEDDDSCCMRQSAEVAKKLFVFDSNEPVSTPQESVHSTNYLPSSTNKRSSPLKDDLDREPFVDTDHGGDPVHSSAREKRTSSVMNESFGVEDAVGLPVSQPKRVRLACENNTEQDSEVEADDSLISTNSEEPVEIVNFESEHGVDSALNVKRLPDDMRINSDESIGSVSSANLKPGGRMEGKEADLVRGTASHTTNRESPAGRPISTDSDLEILEEEPLVFSQRSTAANLRMATDRRAISPRSEHTASTPSPVYSPSQFMTEQEGTARGPHSPEVIRGSSADEDAERRSLSDIEPTVSVVRSPSDVGQAVEPTTLEIKGETSVAGQDDEVIDQSPPHASPHDQSVEQSPLQARVDNYSSLLLHSAKTGSKAQSPLADVWEGFEEGGYIELLDPSAFEGSFTKPTAQTPSAESISLSHTKSSAPSQAAATSRGNDNSNHADLWKNDSIFADLSTPDLERNSTPKSARSRAVVDSSTPGTTLGAPHDVEVSQDIATGSTAKSPKQSAAPIPPEHCSSPSKLSRDTSTPLGTPASPSSTTRTQEGTPAAPTSAHAHASTPEVATGGGAAVTPVSSYRVMLRESNTPMPDYVIMLTPELKEQLARIGVKPIPRRKAVALLSHVYEETHPPAATHRPCATGRAAGSATSGTAATADRSGKANKRDGVGENGSQAPVANSLRKDLPEGSGSTSHRLTGKSQRKEKRTEQKRKTKPHPTESASVPQATPAEVLTSQTSTTSSHARVPAVFPDSTQTYAPNAGATTCSASGDNREATTDPAGSESDGESSGSERAAERMERMLQTLSDDEDDVAPTQTAWFRGDPTAAVTDFLRSHADLHLQVLTYEPLWLESLHAQLKLSGVKLKLGQLMDVLDELCVTFRTESSMARRKKSPKRKRSPKKKSSPSKPSAKSPSKRKGSPKKASTKPKGASIEA